MHLHINQPYYNKEYVYETRQPCSKMVRSPATTQYFFLLQLINTHDDASVSQWLANQLIKSIM